MPLYLALNADGSRQRQSALDVAHVDYNEGLEILTLPQYDVEPDETVLRWNAALKDFEPIVLAAPTTTPVMSRGEWMDRIGGSNEELLHQLRLDPASPLALRAKLERFHSELLRRADVDVRHPSTITASHELADLFFAYGRITDKASFIVMLLAEANV